MEPTPLLADSLTVGYGRPLMERICFQVRPGEILALIGPNGSGKSTILKTLSGQLPELGGRVLIGGRELGAIPKGELAREMALLLTEPVRPDRMTCREVVETGRYPYTGYFGGLSPQDRQAAQEALTLTETQDFADAAFLTVSDGQRQRVMLARAVCQQPKLLLLDEPTAFLDVYHKVTFLELLRRLAEEQGMAVVVSMHEPDLAARAADYAVCLKENRVFAMGPAREVLTAETVMGLFGLPVALYQKYFGESPKGV